MTRQLKLGAILESAGTDRKSRHDPALPGDAGGLEAPPHRWRAAASPQAVAAE